MPPPPTMMAIAAKGALNLSFQPNGTPHVDIDYLESSKCWIGNLTSTPNSTPKSPGTTSYAQKCVANQTPSAAMLAINHGQPEPVILTVICHMIKIEIAQFAKDIANLFLKTTQQDTNVPTNAMTTPKIMMMMTTMPTPATPHCHRNHINLAFIYCEIKLMLAQPITPSPINKDTNNDMTLNATPPMAMSLILTMVPMALPIPFVNQSIHQFTPMLH